MRLVKLTDEQLKEIESILRGVIDSTHDEAANVGRYKDREDVVFAWEYTAKLAGMLAALAKAEEATNAVC